MIKKVLLGSGVSCLALVMGGSLAMAQELDVTQRPRPDYDAAGLRAGSFLIFPSSEVRGEYNSNIFAEDGNETDDFIVVLNPEIDVRSDWNNHALNLGAFVESGHYLDNDNEDYTDYGLATDGRIDILRSANIFGGAGAAHLHEDRGDPNDVNGNEPTEYNRYDANLGGTYKPNRLGVTGEATWRRLDYDNVGTSTGAEINNQDRDRDLYGQRLRVGYDVQPGYTAFVQGALNQRDYDTTPDDSGFDRNSDGYRVDVGVAFAITQTLEGEVFAGYLSQNYDDPRFDTVSGVDAGANVLWSITPLTSLRGVLAREVQETTTAGASSYLATITRVAVDHELRENILLGASAGYTNNDYEGISREDNVYSLGVTGKYLINRRFYAGAEANWVDRDSDAAGQSYDQYVIGVFVGAQF